jgi:hypothetical protein
MKINIWKVSTLGLAAALTFVVATGGNLAIADAQPHMHEALASLQTAKGQLDNADPDKGGHRVAALQLVNQASAEVQKGMTFDDTHKDKRDTMNDTAVPETIVTPPPAQ